MRIISFTGPRGSGKDTCSDILKEVGISLGKISFAGPMKAMLSEIYQLDPNVFEDRHLKEKPFDKPKWFGHYECHMLLELMREYVPEVVMPNFMPCYLNTPREILQFVGTDVIRNQIHEDWHVNAAFSEKGLKGKDPEGIYCVTDARFPNEYRLLTNRFMLDFKGFYVYRPEAEKILETAKHDSELAVIETRKLIPQEQWLYNDKQIEDLKTLLLEKT